MEKSLRRCGDIWLNMRSAQRIIRLMRSLEPKAVPVAPGTLKRGSAGPCRRATQKTPGGRSPADWILPPQPWYLMPRQSVGMGNTINRSLRKQWLQRGQLNSSLRGDG